MALYVLGDPHLSLGCKKPMDVFDGWQDYVQRLESAWQRTVKPGDTVVLAGDISWAMKLEETAADFAFLHTLPGQKLLMKGNHDYWWGTLSKMQRYVEQNGWDTLHFLFNNSYLVEGMAVCGTRSWLFEPGEAHDEKVMAREVGRLRASLQAAQAQWPGAERVAFLHYPPVTTGASAPEVLEALQEFGVKRCFYGHLHSASIRWAVQGERDGILFKLVSADALGFVPWRVEPPAL